MDPVRIYTAYDPPPKVGVECRDKSLARESERDACDINFIMKRYEKTGVLPEAVREGFFADVTAIGDYRSVRDRMIVAEQVFMQLPAVERAKYENDASVFMDFASDAANAEELRRLGLLPGLAADPKVAEGSVVVPDGSKAVGEPSK